MTRAERQLWGYLRGNQMGGYGFRRQHPVGRYVLDFYCPHLKLAIEVDGGQHGDDAVAARDVVRTAFFADRGIHVVRFWNNDMMENVEGVIETIRSRVMARAASTPTPTLPLSGGGRTAVESLLNAAGGGSAADNLPKKGGGRAGGQPDRVGVDGRFDHAPAQIARAASTPIPTLSGREVDR